MAIAWGNYTSKVGSVANDALVAPSVSGLDTVMVLYYSYNTGGAQGSLSATYDAVSITSYRVVDDVYADFSGLSVWVIPNPGSAKTFAVTSGAYGHTMGAFYFTGVNQTPRSRTASTYGYPEPASTEASVSVTNSQTGDLIVGIFCDPDSYANTFSSSNIGAGQTYRFRAQYNTGEHNSAVCTEPGAPSTVDVTWNRDSGVTTGWVCAAIPLIPVGGPPLFDKDHEGTAPWSSVWRPGRV